MSQTAMPYMAEMGRLTSQIAQASMFRTSAIDEVRRTTRATLAAHAERREDVMRRYHTQAKKALEARAREAAAHRRATIKQVASFSSARHKATGQLRHQLKGQVRDLVADVVRMDASLSAAQAAMAKQQRTSLDAGRQHLHAEVASMLDSLRADFAGAHEVWSGLTQREAAPATKRKH
ncbi:MAG: hypothetical protein P4M09_19985 [Devosia sp.]|nr:hypothetical protein [Devosia sp.]